MSEPEGETLGDVLRGAAGLMIKTARAAGSAAGRLNRIDDLLGEVDSAHPGTDLGASRMEVLAEGRRLADASELMLECGEHLSAAADATPAGGTPLPAPAAPPAQSVAAQPVAGRDGTPVVVYDDAFRRRLTYLMCGLLGIGGLLHLVPAWLGASETAATVCAAIGRPLSGVACGVALVAFMLRIRVRPPAGG